MNGGGSGGGGGMGGIGSAIGGIFDAFGNMTKAHRQADLAVKQNNAARSLASTSANTVSPALQKEFEQALQTKQQLAANGITGIDKYNNQLDEHMANSIAAAKEAGGSGDALLATLSSLGHSSDASHVALDEQDAQARTNNINNLVNTMWQVGAERDNNDVIKRTMQAKLNAESGALSNAATINAYTANNKQTDAATGLGASVINLGSSIAGGGGGAKGTSESAPPAIGNGKNATTGNGTDSTNIAGGEEVQTQPNSSNTDWASMIGAGMSAPGN